MDVTNKRVLVVGLGKSGVASALFLKAHGARVTVSDTKPQDELKNEIPALLDQGIVVETGGHGERTFRGQDLIVVSPGVPVDAAPLVQARALNETVRRDHWFERENHDYNPGGRDPDGWRTFDRSRGQHWYPGDLPGGAGVG
jgi:UDP-N-acetylmuramoylalanine-D-glutamate ligase